MGGFSAAKPASDGGLAFIGSGDGKVQAMDVATGNVIWSKTIASKEAPYRTLLYSPWASKVELLQAGADGRKLVLKKEPKTIKEFQAPFGGAWNSFFFYSSTSSTSW